MIFVLYFVVGSHFGFPRLVFCSAFGAIPWMDLYSVDPFSLQNHLSAPSPEMSKGMEEVSQGFKILKYSKYCY